MGRPQIWHPLKHYPGLEHALDGRIRDGSRNVLPDHRLPDSRATILAREWLGKRPRSCCEWCCRHGGKWCTSCDELIRAEVHRGIVTPFCECPEPNARPFHRGPPFRITRLDGNRQNCSRDNLKYEPDHFALAAHIRRCVKECTANDEMRRRTSRTTYAWSGDAVWTGPRSEYGDSRAKSHPDHNWGSNKEYIPPLGVNDSCPNLVTNQSQ